MSKCKKWFLLICMIVLTAGCVARTGKTVTEEKKPVETTKKAEGKQNVAVAVNSSDLDFKRAIQTAVRNMVQSGALDNPAGERYVVTVSSIVDTTKKGFGTKDIKQRLGDTLAAVAGRKVRVVSSSSKSVTPQIILSGRITQRTAFVRKGKRQEYYLHLVLTEAKSGMKLWENTTPVVKKTPQKK